MKLYIGRNAGRTVCLTLPASYEEVDKALAEFGDARPEAPVLIQEARTSVPYLEGRLKGFSFEEKENRQELSFLARRIRYLTQTEQDVFSAVLRMEEPETLSEVINLSYNLDQYERIPHGTDQSELSRMMLKKDKGIEVPAEIAEFLDHERVSSAYFLRHKGEFSPSGLVLKKEGAVPEEVYGNGRHIHPGYEKGGLILLHLYQKGYRSPYGDYALSIPAPMERIALAREHFGVENLDGFGFYTSFVGREDLTDYLPAGLGAEEINRAATFFMEEVLDGTEERLQQLYCALSECLPEGTSIEQELARMLERLYEQTVPAEERRKVEDTVRREEREADAEMWSRRRFVLIKVVKDGRACHLLTQDYCIWTVRTVLFMLIEKRSEMKMDREEIYEMVIREMTETAVRERNEQSPEEQELQEKVARLSKEMQEKIKDLPEDVKKAITDYVEATLLAADHDCLYLYEQGAKDCVALLKKLGVL